MNFYFDPNHNYNPNLNPYPPNHYPNYKFDNLICFFIGPCHLYTRNPIVTRAFCLAAA